MKKLILIYGLLISGASFGADWAYVASGNNQDFYVDKSFYKYDGSTRTIDVWSKATQKKISENEYYTRSKTLVRYSCSNKTSKILANIEYGEGGGSLRSSTKPEINFSLIFPDSIDEAIWHAACSSKGKGFILPKHKGEFVDLIELENKFGKGKALTPEDESRLFPK